MRIISSVSFWTSFLEVMGFQKASTISSSPHNPAQTIPRGGSRLCDQKATGTIVSSKGKALNKAEFKVDYNKRLGPWDSVSLPPPANDS